MLVSRFPFPLEKGDKLRAYHQLRELSQTYSITLFALSDHPIKEAHLSEVEQYCSAVIVHSQSLLQKTIGLFRSWTNGHPFQTGYFYSYRAHKQLRELIQSEKFDHIYCQLVRMSEYVKDEHRVRKTLDYMDALSAGIERRITAQPWWKKWLFKIESRRLKVYEGRMFDFFENRVIISEQDRALIHHPDIEQIYCVPNGISEFFFESVDVEKTHDFVFVGNMSYPPNVEAVAYIADHILPHFPEKKLLISGSSPSLRVKRLAETNASIELTGWVDDIRTSYSRAHIFLAPMMIGTGMQNKLLEAMALGVPCITTSLANNAIKARHENEILVANDPSEYIESIKRLTQNEQLYNELRGNARDFVRKTYTWQQTVEQLQQLFDE